LHRFPHLPANLRRRLPKKHSATPVSNKPLRPQSFGFNLPNEQSGSHPKSFGSNLPNEQFGPLSSAAGVESHVLLLRDHLLYSVSLPSLPQMSFSTFPSSRPPEGDGTSVVAAVGIGFCPWCGGDCDHDYLAGNPTTAAVSLVTAMAVAVAPLVSSSPSPAPPTNATAADESVAAGAVTGSPLCRRPHPLLAYRSATTPTAATAVAAAAAVAPVARVFIDFGPPWVARGSIDFDHSTAQIVTAADAGSDLVNLYDKKSCEDAKISPEILALVDVLRKRKPPGHLGRSFPTLRFDPKSKTMLIEGLVRTGGYGPHIITDSYDLADDAWNAVAKSRAVRHVKTADVVFEHQPHADWFAHNGITLTKQ
jgi:hypothetical protein